MWHRNRLLPEHSAFYLTSFIQCSTKGRNVQAYLGSLSFETVLSFSVTISPCDIARKVWNNGSYKSRNGIEKKMFYISNIKRLGTGAETLRQHCRKPGFITPEFSSVPTKKLLQTVYTGNLVNGESVRRRPDYYLVDNHFSFLKNSLMKGVTFLKSMFWVWIIMKQR